MAIQFTRNGRKAMLWAQVEAMRRGDGYVEPEHLLLGLLHGEETGALRLLQRMGLDGEDVRNAAAANLAPESAGNRIENSQLSPVAKKVVTQARRETEATGDDYVGTEHLLLAILRGGENKADGEEIQSGATLVVLNELGVSYEKAAETIRSLAPEEGVVSTIRPPADPAPDVPRKPAPRSKPVPGFLKGRNLLSVNDFATDEILALFELTRAIKTGREWDIAQKKTLALVFEKPSLRTRVTFGVAMTRLGGQHVYLGRDEIGLNTRETAADVARGLSRWVDAIAARTFSDETVGELAAYATVPVINALSDKEHPCQAFADFYTILESRSDTRGMKLVYVGDGNNVAQSLMLLAPRMGTHITIACPPGYEPAPELCEQAHQLAQAHGTRFEITHDALSASDDADILYTDVWTSMGQESENAMRQTDFAGFQVSSDLIREAKDDVLVLHCLPAHRGEEITGEVIDGPHSGVWNQAENRLHVQQALLAAVL